MVKIPNILLRDQLWFKQKILVNLNETLSILTNFEQTIAFLKNTDIINNRN